MKSSVRKAYCESKMKSTLLKVRGRQPTARGPDAARQGILPGPRPSFFFQ